jgi:uncharacterized PurR-regulated membrane protein YhhQ (DUF165 family)
MNRRTTWALVALYLAAIVAANVIVAHYGPQAIIYNAFFLIGLDLCTRDALASFWGETRWLKQGALILAGAVLSYFASEEAAKIALASGIAFACAESVEAVIYYAVRRMPWVERANISALPAAMVDSIIFPTLAFGSFVWATTFSLFAAKLAGAFVWSVVLGRIRAGGLRRTLEPEYQLVNTPIKEPF